MALEKEGEGEERRSRENKLAPSPHAVLYVMLYMAMFLDVLVLCWLSIQEEMFLTCSNCKSHLSIRHNIFFVLFMINPNCLYRSDSSCSTCGQESIQSQIFRRGCNFVKGGSRRLLGNRNGLLVVMLACYSSAATRVSTPDTKTNKLESI